MENEFNNVSGGEISTATEQPVENIQSAADEYIQSEDFPWEGVEEKSASTSADPAIESDQQEEARTEEAATSGQETEEEKQLNEEIQKLQAENPSGLPKHLRNVASGALRGKREAEAKVVELEQELQTRDAVLFRPSLPAEEFVAQGKPKEFWDSIHKDYPGYYEPMVVDVIKTHLDPSRMQTEPGYMEAVMPLLTDVFAQKWFPDFIQQTFGLDTNGFNALLAQHQAGAFQPGQSQPGAPINPQQIAERFGIDAEADPDLYNYLTQSAASQARMNQLEKLVQSLQNTQGDSVKQQQEAAVTERINTFDSMITADRQNTLDIALKSLPRDASGQIKKEFAHLPQKIGRLIKVALDEDTNYSASRDHAKKWFRQPGNVETAKQLAGGDLKKLYGIHQNLIKQIVNEELTPYVNQIRTQSQFEHTQRAQQLPKGGGNPDIAIQPAPQNPGGRPLTLRDRARGYYEASRRGT